MALLRTVHSNVLCGTPNNVFVELTHFRSFILKSVFITLNKFKFSVSSHRVPLQMAIIFNTEDLKDVKPPCVLQSFINHNAVLYKVFVVGESHTVVERPSLKNFPSGPSGKPSAHTSALYKCYFFERPLLRYGSFHLDWTV